MNRHISSHRLFVDTPLGAQGVYACLASQAHYLMKVLRLEAGALLPVFNGVDGEWLAQLQPRGKKGCDLLILELLRPQTGGPSVHYLFAPLKKARQDYMVQKATEMGVESLQPVLTRRTNVVRLKEERMKANIVEAAEQCGILRLPQLRPAVKLAQLLKEWPTGVPLVFCDEAAQNLSPIESLSKLSPEAPLGLLIGPEGGFDDAERQTLQDLPFVHSLSLGPRIMRADTAAVAALALLNAVLFDWRVP